MQLRKTTARATQYGQDLKYPSMIRVPPLRGIIAMQSNSIPVETATSPRNMPFVVFRSNAGGRKYHQAATGLRTTQDEIPTSHIDAGKSAGCVFARSIPAIRPATALTTNVARNATIPVSIARGTFTIHTPKWFTVSCLSNI